MKPYIDYEVTEEMREAVKLVKENLWDGYTEMDYYEKKKCTYICYLLEYFRSCEKICTDIVDFLSVVIKERLLDAHTVYCALPLEYYECEYHVRQQIRQEFLESLLEDTGFVEKYGF